MQTHKEIEKAQEMGDDEVLNCVLKRARDCEL
jgi:hypothetical protein